MSEAKEETEEMPEKSFEESVRDQAKEFALKRNKLRLMKWLAQKDEQIRKVEAEIKEMIDDCKKGDYTNLPDLSAKEEELLSGLAGFQPASIIGKALPDQFTVSNCFSQIADSVIR